jgi:hypothetical protein
LIPPRGHYAVRLGTLEIGASEVVIGPPSVGGAITVVGERGAGGPPGTAVRVVFERPL